MKPRILLVLFAIIMALNVKAQTVLDIIKNSPDHNTLEAAVIAAGLVGALSGAGTLTVFAPTDAAFSALPAGTVDALLADPQGELTRILTYHVAGVTAKAADLSNGQFVKTLNGKPVSIKIENGEVFVNNAKVTVADVIGTNGVVHVINAVILPPKTVVDIITNSPIHKTLATAATAAELIPTLKTEGPFTIFAPTDAAFSVIPPAVLQSLLNDPMGPLKDILLYHATGSKTLSTTLTDKQRITTLNNTDAKISISNQGIFINNAQITVTDLIADNGVVHVINAVLRPSNTLFDVIAKSANHNTLEAAVRAAGLADAITEVDDVTIFAPDDAAFAKLPAGTVEALLQNIPALTTILKRHVVVDDDYRAEEFVEGEADETIYLNLAGGFSNIVFKDGALKINRTNANAINITATNGIIHSIESVILPVDSTIIKVVKSSAVHNTLESLINLANLSFDDNFISLSEILSSDGPFTLFAPVDAAFNVFTPEQVAALTADKDLLFTVLGEHLVLGTIKSSDLKDGQFLETANGNQLKVTINSNGVFINSSKVAIADILTQNGVVHAMQDVVLYEPTSVMDIVRSSTIHNTLEAALEAAELDGALDDEDATLTLFAPTDAAFAALPAGTVEALVQDPKGALAQILLYHAVGAEAKSTDLSNGQFVTTLNGKSISVKIQNNEVFIDNAKVIVADVVADNGVIHVIDAVILPPKTIADVLIKSPIHKTLVTAATAANIVPALQGTNKLTVFAPTDNAFSALPAGTIETLLADPTGALAQILLYHAVAGETKSTALSDGQTIPTLNGKSVVVNISNGEVFINESKVIVADVVADNGVVHVIDAVLLPPSSTDQSVENTKINVYPNPASEYILIEDTDNTVISAKLMDAQGKLVQAASGLGTIKLNLDCKPGNYFIHVEKNNINVVKSITKI